MSEQENLEINKLEIQTEDIEPQEEQVADNLENDEDLEFLTDEFVVPKEDEEEDDDHGKLFYITGTILGIALIVFGLFMGIRTIIDYQKAKNLYNNTNAEYVVVSDIELPVDTPVQEDGTVARYEATEEDNVIHWYDLISVDLASLKQQNEDIIGWLWFENEDISYPVLLGENNDQYLHTAYDGLQASAGSIFMDCGNQADFSDSHTIIYGHNMKNRTMFGKLRNYRTEGYYEEHQYFQIITPTESYRYQIFAYEDVPEDSFIYQIPFGKTAEFVDFIGRIQRMSFVKTNINVTMEDRILTLSTCSTEGRRLVVHAVLVDIHR